MGVFILWAYERWDVSFYTRGDAVMLHEDDPMILEARALGYPCWGLDQFFEYHDLLEIDCGDLSGSRTDVPGWCSHVDFLVGALLESGKFSLLVEDLMSASSTLFATYGYHNEPHKRPLKFDESAMEGLIAQCRSFARIVRAAMSIYHISSLPRHEPSPPDSDIALSSSEEDEQPLEKRCRRDHGSV